MMQQGDPYKAENTRLLKENNDLHLQILKIKEDTEGKVKELKSALCKSEHECADLKFLNSQYAHKLKALQKQDQAKTSRIQQLHERNMNAVVETPGGRRRHIAPRRPVMEIGSPLPSDDTTKEPQKQDPYMFDLLRIADQQIAELTRQVENLEEAGKAGDRKYETLMKQVSLRDKEIDRLQHLLEGGRPTKAIMNDGITESTDRVISHLNIQVEYLQQTNRELDGKLKASLAKQRELMEVEKAFETKNSALHEQLNIIRGERDKLKLEKESKYDMILYEMENKENEVNQERTRLKSMKAEIKALENEKEKLIGLLGNFEVETEKFTEVVKRLQTEKVDLTKEVKVLEVENEQMKRRIESSQQSQTETLELEIKQLIATSNAHKTKVEILSNELVNLKEELKVKSEDLVYYKQECTNLQSMISKYAIPSRDIPSGTRIEKISMECNEVKQENYALKLEVSKLQSKIKEVASERDNLDGLYIQVSDEVRRLRREKSEVAVSGESLKIERDAASNKLKQALNEKEDLLEQLFKDKNIAFDEISHLKNAVRDYESRQLTLVSERDLLKSQVESMKEKVIALEDEVMKSSTSLHTAKVDSNQTQAQIAHLKSVTQAAQKSRDELHTKISETNMELQLSRQKNAFLEKQVSDLQDSIRSKHAEVVKMRETLINKEKDHDNILSQLDDKSEKIYEMNQKFVEQEGALQALTQDMKELEDKFKEQKAKSSKKKHETETMKKYITRLTEDLSELETARDALRQQNKEMSKDVKSLVEENQRLNDRLLEQDEVTGKLREQAHEREQELRTVEHVIKLKDSDCQDIYQKYKELSIECEKLARDAKQNAESCHSLQKDLEATHDVRNALELRLKEQAVEIQRAVSDNKQLNMKVRELDLFISKQANTIKVRESENRQLGLDLETVREINNKIEGQRDAHAQLSTNRAVEVEQLQHVIETLTEDTKSLKMQLAAEKDCVRNLEYIIHKERQHDYESQEMQEEHRKAAGQLEARVHIQDKELNELQMKYKRLIADYDTLKEQNNKLLRDVTHERFEREKVSNEVNVLKDSMNTSGGNYSLVTTVPSLNNTSIMSDKTTPFSSAKPPRPSRNQLSSNEETDDSIMKIISSGRAAAAVSAPDSSYYSKGSEAPQSEEEGALSQEGVGSVTKTNIESSQVMSEGGTSTIEVGTSIQDLSEYEVRSEAARSDAVFDTDTFDEDDSVYQAIRLSQKSAPLKE